MQPYRQACIEGILEIQEGGMKSPACISHIIGCPLSNERLHGTFGRACHHLCAQLLHSLHRHVLLSLAQSMLWTEGVKKHGEEEAAVFVS
jgi:hypothetical protein